MVSTSRGLNDLRILEVKVTVSRFSDIPDELDDTSLSSQERRSGGGHRGCRPLTHAPVVGNNKPNSRLLEVPPHASPSNELAATFTPERA